MDERNYFFRLKTWYRINDGYCYSIEYSTPKGYIDVIDDEYNIIFFETDWDAELFLHRNWKSTFYFDH